MRAAKFGRRNVSLNKLRKPSRRWTLTDDTIFIHVSVLLQGCQMNGNRGTKMLALFIRKLPTAYRSNNEAKLMFRLRRASLELGGCALSKVVFRGAALT
jgi:hypothetical protein